MHKWNFNKAQVWGGGGVVNETVSFSGSGSGCLSLGAVGYLSDESAPQGSAASRHLKEYTVPDWATECGNEFQSGMVMCTNDFWSSVVLVIGLKSFFLFLAPWMGLKE